MPAAGGVSLYESAHSPVHGGFRPLRRAGCAAPALRGRARGRGTSCSPSSCQSPPLPSGRAARVKPGNVKRFPPVYRTKQSLPFRTPRGERLHRPNKFFYPELLCEPASRNTPVFFAAVPVSGALRQQSVRRPSNQRGDSQEGNFPSCAPAAQAAKSVRFQGFSRLSNCVIIILIINTLKGARLTWLTFLYKT